MTLANTTTRPMITHVRTTTLVGIPIPLVGGSSLTVGSD